MGYGDVLMTMGEAKRLHEATGKTICLPRRYRPQLYAAIPYITDDPSRAEIHLTDAFPATDLAGSTDERIAFKRYAPIPADLVTPPMAALDALGIDDFVFVEPHAKAASSADNRLWEWGRYVKVIRSMDVPFVQPSYGKPILPGVHALPTASFLEAAAVLRRARTALMPEGGMMHAAAAVGVPSVVIFGGFISPENTGYGMHANLYVGGEPCGSRRPCPHCREAMASIGVERVIEELRRLWARRGAVRQA